MDRAGSTHRAEMNVVLPVDSACRAIMSVCFAAATEPELARQPFAFGSCEKHFLRLVSSLIHVGEVTFARLHHGASDMQPQSLELMGTQVSCTRA